MVLSSRKESFKSNTAQFPLNQSNQENIDENSLKNFNLENLLISMNKRIDCLEKEVQNSRKLVYLSDELLQLKKEEMTNGK